jgi:hypothetical protein
MHPCAMVQVSTYFAADTKVARRATLNHAIAIIATGDARLHLGRHTARLYE